MARLDNDSYQFVTLRDSQMSIAGEKPIELGRIRCSILRELIDRPRQVCSYDDLIKKCWPDAGVVEKNAGSYRHRLAVHIHEIRRRSGLKNEWIEAVHERGYRYASDVLKKELTEHGRIPFSQRASRGDSGYDEQHILDSGFRTVETALKTIFDKLARPENQPLEELWLCKLKKHARLVNMAAQSAATETLSGSFDQIEIRGKDRSLESITTSGLAALLNALDGTELMAHQLGNWCSALVIFETLPKLRVYAAFIGMPNRQIFFAKKSDSQAFVTRMKEQDGERMSQAIRLRNKKVALRDAAICFYGQRPGRLLSMFRNTGFRRLLEKYSHEAQLKKNRPDAPQMRIYNLGGNPMVMRLILGDVDALVEVDGQQSQDVVPAAIIALRAGAVLYNLTTCRKVTEDDLVALLGDPSKKLRFVMAANNKLAKVILRELGNRKFT